LRAQMAELSVSGRSKMDAGAYVIPVPLVGVNVSCELVNFTAQVTVTQDYVNKEEQPIECKYFFPIEEEAVVVDFKAQLEGRTLISKVKTAEEATKDYNEAVQAGKTSFMAEQARSDILQLKVGHLAAGAGCTISITYIYEAPLENGKTRLTIPTTISPKYIPFHDSSTEAKHIASIQYDFKSPAKLQFRLVTHMKSKIEAIASPSHAISTTGGQNPDHLGVHQATTEFKSTTADMDRDIVILIESGDPNKSVVFQEENADSKMMMLTLVPSLQTKTQQEMDIIFLIDCSGSMNGSSILLAQEAINILLHSLPTSVTFNIVRFGSRFTKTFPNSQLYTDSSLQAAKNSMANLQANMGGTEILSPLTNLLEEDSMVPRRIFILTDGSVSNSSECIKLAKKHNNNCRIFTLGIGSSADRSLVKGLARAGLGTAEFTVEGEVMAPKVLKQLKNCLQPNMSNLTIDWGESTMADDDKHQAPAILPPIYSGHRLQIFKLFPKEAKFPEKVVISAKIPGQIKPYIEDVIVDTSVMKGNLLHQMYARKIIQGLEESYEENKELKSRIADISLQYQIMSKFTSFIAIDNKENKTEEVMVVRQVSNQVPFAFGFGFAPMRRATSRLKCFPTLQTGAAPLLFGASPAFMCPPAPTMDVSDAVCRMKKKKKSYTHDVDQTSLLLDEQDFCNSPSVQPHSIQQSFSEYLPTENEVICDEMAPDDMVNSQLSIVMKLISLQSADGHFRREPSFFKLCSLNEAEVETVRGAEVEDAFYTLLIIELLETQHQEHKDYWELVAEKGKAWLDGQEVLPQTKQQIGQFVRKLVKV